MSRFIKIRDAGVAVPKVKVYPNGEGDKHLEPLVCDSPIEGAFVELLFKTLKVHGLTIWSQYQLGGYRYDFAIAVNSSKLPIILIECDGRNYHWTPEQLANDRRKDAFARKNLMEIMRFTGSDIYNRPSLCLDAVLLKIESLGGGPL